MSLGDVFMFVLVWLRWTFLALILLIFTPHVFWLLTSDPEVHGIAAAYPSVLYVLRVVLAVVFSLGFYWLGFVY